MTPSHPALVLRQAQDEGLRNTGVLESHEGPRSTETLAVSHKRRKATVALMVSLSNHEGVAL